MGTGGTFFESVTSTPSYRGPGHAPKILQTVCSDIDSGMFRLPAGTLKQPSGQLKLIKTLNRISDRNLARLMHIANNGRSLLGIKWFRLVTQSRPIFGWSRDIVNLILALTTRMTSIIILPCDSNDSSSFKIFPANIRQRAPFGGSSNFFLTSSFNYQTGYRFYFRQFNNLSVYLLYGCPR